MRYDTHSRNQASPTSVPLHPGGSYCPPYFRSPDVTVPGCGRPVMPLCDVQKVGNVLRANAGGDTAFTITVAPIRTNYFQPLAVRMAAIDGTNADINRRFEIHQVTINATPQEAFSNAAPLAANTSVVLVDDYVLPDGYGVPVAWGIFAQAALIYILQIGCVNIEPANVTLDAYVSVYGNALDVLPPGYVPGTPFIQA